jgi:hypothetical protein
VNLLRHAQALLENCEQFGVLPTSIFTRLPV